MVMNSEIKNTVVEGIFNLISGQAPFFTGKDDAKKKLNYWLRDAKYENFIEKVKLIVDELIKIPYSSAFSISKKFALSFSELAAIYKIIQTSDPIQQELMCSYNSDYINIVKSHFDTKAFEVVFFVGLSCPLKCIFCPSVEIHTDGKKTLRQYPHNSGMTITQEEIARVFVDIKKIQESGINVLVKISGGLEPFTNIENIEWILEQTCKYGIPSQIFTNGILLDTKEKRALALTASGVRVSVSAPNQKIFRKICLNGGKSSKYSFEPLVENLNNLMTERNNSASNTIVGINSVIGAFNWRWFEKLIDLAVNIGVDQIDLKPDYFSEDKRWMDKINEKILNISASLTNGKKKHTRIMFAGSINKHNVFNDKIKGKTSISTQSNHKIFITPYGECSPVHHGAFPKKVSPDKVADNAFRLGKVTSTKGITDLISNVHTLPEIEYDLLNPYERILALESKRIEEDEQFGIKKEYSPYYVSNKNKPFTLPLPDMIKEIGQKIGESHDLRT